MTALPKIPRLAPNITKRIHAAAVKNHERTEPKVTISMGALGGCERNLWAELHGVPDERPPDGRTCVLFDMGHSVEELVVQLLKDADYEVEDVDPETGNQFELWGLDKRLHGFTDGKIKINGTWRLLEIKSASSRKPRDSKDKPGQFEMCVSLGYEKWNPKYAAQIQGYMGFSGLEDSVCIIKNKNTSELYVEKVRFDPDKFSALLDKAVRILEAEEILPRPAEGKSQYCSFCKWCPHNQWCWSATAGVKFDE